MRNIDDEERKEEKKRLVKIVVHLRHCQSTALTVPDCYADARAKTGIYGYGLTPCRVSTVKQIFYTGCPEKLRKIDCLCVFLKTPTPTTQ